MLQHTSVQEVSMSVKDKKRVSHQGPQCAKCVIDCITSDMLNNSRWGILQVLIKFVMTGTDSDREGGDAIHAHAKLTLILYLDI